VILTWLESYSVMSGYDTVLDYYFCWMEQHLSLDKKIFRFIVNGSLCSAIFVPFWNKNGLI
jgi:hypothetical protein